MTRNMLRIVLWSAVVACLLLLTQFERMWLFAVTLVLAAGAGSLEIYRTSGGPQ